MPRNFKGTFDPLSVQWEFRRRGISFLFRFPRVTESSFEAPRTRSYLLILPGVKRQSHSFQSSINWLSPERLRKWTWLSALEIKIDAKQEEWADGGKLEAINETEGETNNKLLLTPKAGRKLRIFFYFRRLAFCLGATNYTRKIENEGNKRMSIN